MDKQTSISIEIFAKLFFMMHLNLSFPLELHLFLQATDLLNKLFGYQQKQTSLPSYNVQYEEMLQNLPRKFLLYVQNL